MPRNLIDGIKTKKGRVVYDRTPDGFTLRDLTRICKNAGTKPGFDRDVYTCYDLRDFELALRPVVEKLFIMYLDRGCQGFADFFATNLRILCDKYSPEIELGDAFSGGESGGGGATRDY